MKRFREISSLSVLILASLWAGIDYLFIRDGTGLYSYYGSFNHQAEILFSSLMILGSVISLAGFVRPMTGLLEVGFRFAAIGWMLYGAGFALVIPAVWLGVDNTIFAFPSWFSQLGIAVVHLTLAHIYFSTADYVSRRRV